MQLRMFGCALIQPPTLLLRDVMPSGKTAEGADEALKLLRVLGEGFRHLSMYRCKARRARLLPHPRDLT